MGDEAIGQISLLVQQCHHLVLVNHEDGAGREGLGRAHANRLPGEAAFAEEVAGAQHRDDRLPPCPGQHREADCAVLDVEDGGRRIALRVDPGIAVIGDDRAPQARGIQKLLHVEAPRLSQGLLLDGGSPAPHGTSLPGLGECSTQGRGRSGMLGSDRQN